MSILLATYNYDYQFKENEVDSVCGMHGTEEKYIQGFCGKPEAR
jgi:hypothetical protein